MDRTDKKNIRNTFDMIQRVKGFYCLLGPGELHRLAIEEFDRLFRKSGQPVGAAIDLTGISIEDIEQLAEDCPPCLYLLGLPDDRGLRQIELKRDVFHSRKIILIFMLIPIDYKRFAETAIWTTLRHECRIGAQRTLDAMGDPFQRRLFEVLDRIDDYEENLNEVVKSAKSKQSDSLVILRRWNSFSPILSRRPATTVDQTYRAVWSHIRREIRGGGYLLRWQGHGIAIDPGFNFIENLYESGYSIADIDTVIITHDHLDHTADFEAIIDLIYQYNKRGTSKEIAVYLNPTTFRKYRAHLSANKNIRRVVELRSDKTTFSKVSSKIRLFSIPAKHKELGGFEQAVSIRLELFADTRGKKVSVGFTGDTGWHENLEPFFRNVDLLVPHLGSVKRYELEEAKFYEHHLGILGLFRLLEDLADTGSSAAVVLSEFGEELKGLRDILGKELGEKFRKMKVIPGDIGHTIELSPAKVRIVCGQKPKCGQTAVQFFEHDGEIKIRCPQHESTFGTIGASSPQDENTQIDLKQI